MPHRHPAVLAKMAATVDIISGGRLQLGLGAAWNHMECDAYGIELGAPSTRLDRFEEGIEVITRLLRDETTTFVGEHYRLTDARCSPKPRQHPHPPITIGGAGERRTARIVARWADHWDLGFTPPHDVPRKLAALAEHCKGLGRDPSDITISAVIRTRNATGMRDLHDVTNDIERYAAAGCTLAIVEAAPTDAAQIPVVLDRLMAACRPLAETEKTGRGEPLDDRFTAPRRFSAPRQQNARRR
jgi:alkanesulfonate monooxygenase SsuD/methylene tetrahydromethanopterin reductase-like flavin-dependent oxidoreductase (luciferase family)